jgi:hypothetical protein
VAIQAAGRTDKVVCYACNEPGHYASRCPHKEARVKQLEIELAALRAGEDFLDTDEEDVYLFNKEGPIEELIGTSISLRPIDIAPHLFEEEGSSDSGDSPSLRLQSIRTETFPPSNHEGYYREGRTTSSLSLRGMERLKPLRIEEETSWRPWVIKNSTPLDKEDPAKYRCLRIQGTINGHPVRCLADSGSTADVISSDVVGLYSLPTAPLTETLIVKMACIGSRAKANRKCSVTLVIQGIPFRRDFVVVSVNENVILGTPFLVDYSATMGFNPLRLSLIPKVEEDSKVRLVEVQQVQVATASLALEEREHLRTKWLKEFEPLTSGIPEGLPPWREVNHRIELVDPNLVIRHRRV